VTRACSSGQLVGCGCDLSIGATVDRTDGIAWSGCSDNIDFGIAFAHNFIDSADTPQLLQAEQDDVTEQQDDVTAQEERIHDVTAQEKRTKSVRSERLAAARGLRTKAGGAANRARVELTKQVDAVIESEKMLLTLHNNNVGRQVWILIKAILLSV